jgi:hypothetical protein
MNNKRVGVNKVFSIGQGTSLKTFK